MIDAHAHLTDERLASEVEAVLARAAEAGVEAVVTIATHLEDARAAALLASSYPNLFSSAGVHPHQAEQGTEEALAAIAQLAATHERVVAIGESGLDYHYDFAPRPVQRRVFERQLQMAAELDLPIVVHARDADDDVAALLRAAPPVVRGVLHCFSSGPVLLQTGLELGWYVSFAGMITFPKYADADLLRAVPLNRLMVETDSPYLAPVPHRGRRNEPAYVVDVARRAAELRGQPFAEVAAATAANARTFYRLPA
jgi:TatD DNase family protein